MASDRAAPYPAPQMFLFAVGALALYRLGCQIPLPGLDSDILNYLRAEPRGLGPVSIFRLGVTPIFTVMVLVEIAKSVCRPLARFEARGEAQALRLNRVIQVAALAVAALQGYGVARGIEGRGGFTEGPASTFEWETVSTFVAATALLGWLAGRMTVRGVRAGFWILLLAPYLARLPAQALASLELVRIRVIDPSALWITGGLIVLAMALIVLLAKACLPAMGGRPARVEPFLDVWPPLLALSVAGAVNATLAAILRTPTRQAPLAVGEPLHVLLVAALIAGFALLRASAPHGPGAMRRPVWLMALAQIAISCGGEWLPRVLRLPFAIDGAWIIVYVATALAAMAPFLSADGDRSSTSAMSLRAARTPRPARDFASTQENGLPVRAPIP
jgi:hypothetical protein